VLKVGIGYNSNCFLIVPKRTLSNLIDLQKPDFFRASSLALTPAQLDAQALQLNFHDQEIRQRQLR
jgi:hypothetical protein